MAWVGQPARPAGRLTQTWTPYGELHGCRVTLQRTGPKAHCTYVRTHTEQCMACDNTVKPAEDSYSMHLWANYNWPLQRGGHITEAN